VTGKPDAGLLVTEEAGLQQELAILQNVETAKDIRLVELATEQVEAPVKVSPELIDAKRIRSNAKTVKETVEL
jgi:hypothetical protein